MSLTSSPPPPGAYFNPQPAPSKGSPMAIVAIFVGVMLALGLIAVLFVVFNQPPPPIPPCQPGQPCAPKPSLPPVAQGSPTPRPSGGPTSAPTAVPPTLAPGTTPTPFVPPTATPVSDSPEVLSGTVWQSSTLNYSFEYDTNSWTLIDSSDDTAVFSSVRFDAQTIIHAVPAATSPDELIAQQLGQVDTFMISRVKDTDDYDALLGPSIGFVNGLGSVWSGTLLSNDGTPVAPGGVTVLAATDGRLTVSVVVIVGSPDAKVGSGTQQHRVRTQADDFLKSFDWDTR